MHSKHKYGKIGIILESAAFEPRNRLFSRYERNKIFILLRSFDLMISQDVYSVKLFCASLPQHFQRFLGPHQSHNSATSRHGLPFHRLLSVPHLIASLRIGFPERLRFRFWSFPVLPVERYRCTCNPSSPLPIVPAISSVVIFAP